MWWNSLWRRGNQEKEMWRRIREAERNAIIGIMAEQMMHLIRKGVPKPVSIDEWMAEFFRNQPACGEVIHEAPAEWIRTNPDEALAWYSKHVLPVGPAMENIVKGRGLIR